VAVLKPDWIAAVGSVLLAILAVFQDKIRNWLTRPRLKVQAKTQPPLCRKTWWMHPWPPGDLRYDANKVEAEYFPCYYFGLEISNVGNMAASNVEVYASSLTRKRADEEFEPVSRFTPMNLKWAHEHTVYLPLLSPKMFKFCAVGHIIAPAQRKRVGHDLPGVADDQGLLALDLQEEPTMKGYLVEPGQYRLTLVVTAANSTPKQCEIEFVFSGDWYDSEEEMFRRGFGMRIL
jgi:hypothetical protein